MALHFIALPKTCSRGNNVSENFVNVKLTLREKMILVFFDLFPERLINKKVVYTSRNITDEKISVETKSINTSEKFPSFFENIDDGKSNF